MTIPLLISMLLILAQPVSPREQYSATDYERMARAVVDEMNRVRRDPAAYAEQYIRPRRARYKGKAYEVTPTLRILSEEGVAAVDDCLRALANAKPAGALTWSEGLARAASDHVKDQGASGRTGHTGGDDSSPSDRVERYGVWKKTVGENIGYGSAEPREIVIQLLVDDGVPGRGHRANILNPLYHAAGVAIGPHEEFRFMCVMDLAGGFTDK